MAVFAPTTTLAADPDPLLEFLQAAAAAEGKDVKVEGDRVTVQDPADDQGFPTGEATGVKKPINDILVGDLVEFPSVPPTLLSSQFLCTDPMVICSQFGSDDAAFANGAVAIYEGLGGSPTTADPTKRLEWGVLTRNTKFPPSVAAPGRPNDPFNGVSHAWIVRMQGGNSDLGLFVYTNGQFGTFRTHARARMTEMGMALLIPYDKEWTAIGAWDLYAFCGDGTATPAGTGSDVLRILPSDTLVPYAPGPTGTFVTPAPPSPTPTASPTPTPAATPVPSATPAASTSASPSQPPSGETSGTGGFPWLLVVVIGLLAAGLGALLMTRARRKDDDAKVGGGVIAMGVESGDPCPPLIAAAKAAQAACEAAIAAATAAADAARARAAEAHAARAALDKARAAREAAERELEKRRQPPDRGRRLGGSSYGGRDVYVDEYDLWLQEQARAAANAAHKAATDAATTDAERQQAHDDWMRELDSVDGADGLDEVRRRDKDGRRRWIQEAEASLKAAQEAEAEAEAEAARTAQAATAAEAEAAAAKASADEACAKAAAAAAAAADCIKLQTPVVPTAGGGTPLDGGGTPPQPPEPPTPPTPPVPPTPPTPPPGRSSTRRPCPEGSEPRVTVSGEFEVELFVLSGAQLKIDGAYMFGDDEAQAAIDGLGDALAAADVGVTLVGAATSPGVTLLGKLGVPSFDTVTNAPTSSAMNALQRLKEQLSGLRKLGTWTLSVPKQRFKFSCRVTESCVDGEWVVTSRDFHGERIGSPRYVPSDPVVVADLKETNFAWSKMSGRFTSENKTAERKIEAAARSCGG